MKPDFKIGDEVYLEKGARAWANIPEKYVYSRRPFSEILTKQKISIGVLYTNEEITKRSIKEEANHIANIIFDIFMNKGYEISFDKCKKFVNSNIDVEKKIELTRFIIPEGVFIITDIVLHPESGGHNDIHPAWYEYYAKRINGDDIVSFENWQYYNDEWHFINKQQSIN